MVQRSTPQGKIDDAAWPIRISLLVPSGGLMCLSEMHAWLKAEIGLGEYADGGGFGLAQQTKLFYFRRIEDASRFLAAFPDQRLADGTETRAYTSPLFPRGRAGGLTYSATVPHTPHSIGGRKAPK